MPARKSSVVSETPRAVRPRAAAASVKPVTRTARHKKAVVAVVGVNHVEPVSAESIARLAYSYWEARGYQHGNPHEDWLRAERELGLTPSLN